MSDHRSIDERSKKAQELRGRAAECVKIAKRMSQQSDRRIMMELADQLLALADSHEAHAPATSRHH
jgi:hypothetical protein